MTILNYFCSFFIFVLTTYFLKESYPENHFWKAESISYDFLSETEHRTISFWDTTSQRVWIGENKFFLVSPLVCIFLTNDISNDIRLIKNVNT